MSATKPKTPAHEHRCYAKELRAKKTDAGITVSGLAAPYGVMSEDLGMFKEVIAPRTFRRAVEEKQDVRMLLNHNSDIVLARTKPGTLVLEDAPDGLRFEAKLAATRAAEDLLASIERGDIDGMSFGFRTVRDNWKFEGPIAIRELLDVDLFDISPTAFPAYPDTSIAKRHLQSLQEGAERSMATRRARQRLAEMV